MPVYPLGPNLQEIDFFMQFLELDDDEVYNTDLC